MADSKTIYAVRRHHNYEYDVEELFESRADAFSRCDWLTFEWCCEYVSIEDLAKHFEMSHLAQSPNFEEALFGAFCEQEAKRNAFIEQNTEWYPFDVDTYHLYPQGVDVRRAWLG